MLRRLALLVALTLGLAAGPSAQSLSADGSAGTSARSAPAAEAPAGAAGSGTWRPASTPVEMLPVYYVVERRPDLRAGPGSGRVLGQLDFRRGVRIRAEQGAWRLVEDVQTGQSLGWVESTALSNVWLLMDKPSRTLYVYRGGELIRQLAADVSANPEGTKIRRAGLTEHEHQRIPEGEYFVTSRNPNSQYYRSFMLNYPNADDAARGLAMGLITRTQYRAIVDAADRFQSPPMGTILGGAIAIHGQGSGRRRAWTRGCVALRDVHMDMLWDIVHVGTPVFIR